MPVGYLVEDKGTVVVSVPVVPIFVDEGADVSVPVVPIVVDIGVDVESGLFDTIESGSVLFVTLAELPVVDKGADVVSLPVVPIFVDKVADVVSVPVVPIVVDIGVDVVSGLLDTIL